MIHILAYTFIFLLGLIVGMEVQTFFVARSFEKINCQNLAAIRNEITKPQKPIVVELLRKNLKQTEVIRDPLNLLDRAGLGKNHGAEFV